MHRRGFLQVSAGGAITPPEFQPKSMLRVAERPVERARFPVIDIHTHLFSLGRNLDPASAEVAQLLGQIARWMDECRLQTLINLTGGSSQSIPAIRQTFAPFGRYQDRILFGTDATPRGEAFPQQDLKPAMFRCYFRFLETDDEYFDCSPAAVPPQGLWRIYGIGLPEAILRKVYRDNARSSSLRRSAP